MCLCLGNICTEPRPPSKGRDGGPTWERAQNGCTLEGCQPHHYEAHLGASGAVAEMKALVAFYSPLPL